MNSSPSALCPSLCPAIRWLSHRWDQAQPMLPNAKMANIVVIIYSIKSITQPHCADVHYLQLSKSLPPALNGVSCQSAATVASHCRVCGPLREAGLWSVLIYHRPLGEYAGSRNAKMGCVWEELGGVMWLQGQKWSTAIWWLPLRSGLLCALWRSQLVWSGGFAERIVACFWGKFKIKLYDLQL